MRGGKVGIVGMEIDVREVSVFIVDEFWFFYLNEW